MMPPVNRSIVYRLAASRQEVSSRVVPRMRPGYRARVIGTSPYGERFGQESSGSGVRHRLLREVARVC